MTNQDQPEESGGELADYDMDLGWIRYVGGGAIPSGTVWSMPPGYARALGQIFEPLDLPVWQEWWRSTGQPPCHIYAWIGVKSTRTTIRRGRRRVHVSIDRAVPAEIVEDRRYPPELGPIAALNDAEAMITRLKERFQLSDPPLLGTPDRL